MRWLAALLLILSASPAWAQELSEVEYIRTIDGDTVVVVEGDEELHVRLLGINTPELGEGSAAAFAAAFVLAFVLERSGSVYLEREDGEEFDHYGRTLAWLWADCGSGPVELNTALVTAGLAVEAWGGVRR